MAASSFKRKNCEGLAAERPHDPAGDRTRDLRDKSKIKILRRLHLLYLGGTLAIFLPGVAVGQPPGKPAPVIGLLTWASCDGPPNARGLGEFGALESGLVDLGYKPGENVTIECRSANRRYEGFQAAATELVRVRADVIVASSQSATEAAGLATHTIPIVTIADMPFANSFAAPEGNLTGAIYSTIELTDKRLELLKEMVPSLANVGVLSNPNGNYPAFEGHARRAAGELDIAASFHRVSEPADLEDAFARMKAEGAMGVFVSPDLMFESEASRIAALAVQYRLPTMTWDRRLTEAGCLLAYSVNNSELERRLAFYVDRVLNGVAAGDLPIERASSFWLSINLRTAKALGIEVPPSLLLMADEVIE